jgi:DNA-binding response OmpR family regulator
MEGPKRIVVADDDPKVRRLLEHALKAPEFEVHAFPTGAAALQAMPHLRPDCVVSDMLMPDMDGERFLRGVRSISGLESVPFLVVSAIRSDERIQSVLSAGASAFLLKPFPVRELVRRIRALLDGSTVPPAPPSPRDTAQEGPLESLLLDDDFHYEEAPEAPHRTELRPPATSLGFGRYTQVTQRGRSFVVLTEVEVEPRFTVTTVISEKGVGRRKIQTSLPHPLAREEDREVARRRVDLQHEEAIEHLPELVDDGPSRRVVWSDRSRTVDADLLAWTVSAVARVAKDEVGPAESLRLLRRTLDRAALDEADLRVFEVTPRGRVVVSGRAWRLPRRVVGAVAGWCRDLLAESLQAEANTVVHPIRRATRQRGRELERIGFYERLENATAS